MDLAARKYRLIKELVKIEDERLMENLEKILNLEHEGPELSHAQKIELDRRLKQYEEKPEDLLNWSAIKSSW